MAKFKEDNKAKKINDDDPQEPLLPLQSLKLPRIMNNMNPKKNSALTLHQVRCGGCCCRKMDGKAFRRSSTTFNNNSIRRRRRPQSCRVGDGVGGGRYVT